MLDSKEVALSGPMGMVLSFFKSHKGQVTLPVSTLWDQLWPFHWVMRASEGSYVEACRNLPWLGSQVDDLSFLR